MQIRADSRGRQANHELPGALHRNRLPFLISPLFNPFSFVFILWIARHDSSVSLLRRGLEACEVPVATEYSARRR